MACVPLTTFHFTCDRCPKVVTRISNTLPLGWTRLRLQFEEHEGDNIKEKELCHECTVLFKDWLRPR